MVTSTPSENNILKYIFNFSWSMEKEENSYFFFYKAMITIIQNQKIGAKNSTKRTLQIRYLRI